MVKQRSTKSDKVASQCTCCKPREKKLVFVENRPMRMSSVCIRCGAELEVNGLFCSIECRESLGDHP